MATFSSCSLTKPHFIFKYLKSKGWSVKTGWRRTFVRPSKKKNEGSVRKRSQAKITTVCCSDGGDNTLWGEQKAGSLNLRSPRLYSTLSPKRGSRSPWLLSKGSPRGQTKVTYRKELRIAQRNQNLSSNGVHASFLCCFFFVFSILVDFSVFFFFGAWDRGFLCTVSRPVKQKKKKTAAWGKHLLL